MYGTGISLAGDVLDTAVEVKIVDKAGSWYSYNGERIGQGRENVKEFLQNHPEILEEIRSKVMAEFKPDTTEDDDIQVDEDGVVIEN